MRQCTCSNAMGLAGTDTWGKGRKQDKENTSNEFWAYLYVLQKGVSPPDWVPLKINFPGSILSVLPDNFVPWPPAVTLGAAVNDYSLFIFPETLSFTYICHVPVLS